MTDNPFDPTKSRTISETWFMEDGREIELIALLARLDEAGAEGIGRDALNGLEAAIVIRALMASRSGPSGDWPCAFHLEPTPGCEMCRNEGGSGQRLEMPRDGAERDE